MPSQSVLDSMDTRRVGAMNLIQSVPGQSMARNIRGIGCVIYNYGDPNAQTKISAIDAGVALLATKGYALPNRITFLLSNTAQGFNKAPTEAYARNKRGEVAVNVFLGVNAVWDGGAVVGSEGIAHKLDRKKKGTYSTTVVVHELGHVLHDVLSTDYFWSTEAGGVLTGGDVTTAFKEISPYAATNPKEVVAEVFCAHNMGYKLSTSKVRPLYTKFHGPPLL